MAGMFSLLHKSQLRLDMTAGSAAIEDNSSDFRKKSANNRSPLPGKRILRQVQMKTGGCNTDRVPKRFRKRRCNELHPLLRRSICTLLLAGCGIVTGLTLVLVDYFAPRTISIAGIIVLAVAVFVFLIGVVWLWWSCVQLCRYRDKLAALHEESEAQRKKTSSGEQLDIGQHICDPAALSASKWPKKQVLPEQDTESRDAYTMGEDFVLKASAVRNTSKQKEQVLSLRNSMLSIDSEDVSFDNPPSNGRQPRTGWSSTSKAKEDPRICVFRSDRG